MKHETRTRIFWGGLFLGHLALTVVIWSQVSAHAWSGTFASRLVALGDLAGLVAFTLVLWQLLLIGRIPWLERAWGHDRLSSWHHVGGLTAIGILLIHPLLVTMGYAQQAGDSFVPQFIRIVLTYHDGLQAFIGYALFIVLVLLSLEIVMRRMRYETWYFVHLTLYAAIILAFGHQTSLGEDFAQGWTATAWTAVFYGVLALFVVCRFGVPLTSWFRHRFRIIGVEREADDTYSILIGGRDLARYPAKAGQFAIVRFLARGFWYEAHPFSFSERPDGTRLRITVKALGDHTRRMVMLPVGTPVLLEGPLGRFTVERAEHPHVVLVAGGIGITPLRALFEEFRRIGRDVDLFYAARDERAFVFRDELDRLAAPTVRVRYLASDRGERVTGDSIRRSIPDLMECDVYICGPRGMMDGISQQLVALGVPPGHIHMEKFMLG
ncbi:MAG TPA: ferric reductase-like transmembrane domain-containing protein [Candidatus Paceibacterota bacterium]|nr:ferric reductase-like transmembrane domain-containing protein [Candidatus Paceibacterota bacterium]